LQFQAIGEQATLRVHLLVFTSRPQGKNAAAAGFRVSVPAQQFEELTVLQNL
jgi:hypothetical protein